MDGLLDIMLTKIWNKCTQESSQSKQKRNQDKETFKNRFFNANNEDKRIIKVIFKSPFHANSTFSQILSKVFTDSEATTFEVSREQPMLLLEEDIEKYDETDGSDPWDKFPDC